MIKEVKTIKLLKLTSIFFGFILGLLSIFLVLNESFALFTSKTDKKTYSFETYKLPMLTTGDNFRKILRSYKGKITEVAFEVNKDLNTIDTSVASYDLSYNNNKTITGYLTVDPDRANKYILHIATEEDKIYANPDSSDLFLTQSPGYSTGGYNGIFSGLTSIRNLLALDTSKVITMAWMFAGCTNLTGIDLSNFDTENVKSMEKMFEGCSKLTSLDLSSFNTSNVKNMQGMFDGCTKLTSLDVSGFNTDKVEDMASMFYNCSKLTSLDLSSFNTSNVTRMSSMFNGCSSLTELDVSGFNTINVYSMSQMFSICSKLTSLNVTNFNTDKVEDMYAMFVGCSSLTELDVSGFNTSNVYSMDEMFSSCSKLTSLNVTNFNTENVESMYAMFRDCSGLTRLDLSNFITNKVRGSSGGYIDSGTALMFSGCTNLGEIKLNNAELGQVREYNDMFTNVPTNVHIYLKYTQTNQDFMSNNFSDYTHIDWV